MNSILRKLTVPALALMLGACGSDDVSYVPTYTAPNRPARFAMRGPFATARRAMEVRNAFLQQGYNAIYYHSGDGYYVKIKY